MSTSPQEWFMSLPPVSRTWLAAAVLSGLAARLGLLDPYAISLSLPLVWKKFQIWRLVTNFGFMGMPSFNWLFEMFMLSQYAPALEQDPYPSGGGSRAGNSADFTFMLIFGGLVLMAVSWLLGGIPFLGAPLFAMVIYVWSRRHPANQVRFFFFPPFPAVYLPWVMAGFAFIVGGDPMKDLLGIAAGHLFFMLASELPEKRGLVLLKTPDFMYRLFGLPPTHAPMAQVRMAAAAAGGEGGGAGWATGRAAYGGAPGAAGTGAGRPDGVRNRWVGQGHVLGR